VCFLLSVDVSAQEESDALLIESIEEEKPDFDEESQEKTAGFAGGKNNFWFGFSGDTAMYSQYGFAFGPGFSIGFGARLSIGVKAAWFFTKEGIDVLEVNVLLRFYLLKKANSGLFFEIMGGPALYNRSGEFSTPSNAGSISAGAAFGWRFVLFNRWFIEPSIRGGYPYLFGASVLTGVRL